MLTQLLRPLRGHCNRLLATSVGAKAAGDNEQLDLLSLRDAAFIDKGANPSSPAECGDKSSLLVGRLSSWLSKSISTQLAIENEPHYMFAPGDGDLYTPEAYSVVPLANDSSNTNNVAASVMVALPMYSMFNGNIAMPSWMDMRLYQTPLAPYQQQEGLLQQAPSGPLLTTAVLMQPMIMPVFYPYGIMQIPSGSEQPTPDVTIAASGDQADRDQCEAPEVACKEPTITATGAQQADPQQCEASDVTRQGPRHRRSRRGGAAARKKLAAARQSEHVDDAATVVETAQVCDTSTTQVPSDPALKDDIQSLSTEAGTPKAAGDDSTPASSIHCEMVLDRKAKSTPNEADTLETIDPMLAELDSSDEERRQLALDWVSKSFWPLALTRRGSRILQQAISVGSPVYLQHLLGNIRGQVQEAMQSPHANHVLQKFIEIMPPERTHFVVSELEDQILRVARHRFGCRILQRLVEHHAPQQTEQMIDKVLMDAASLCRHQYGNYVIQHILQYGSPSQRSAIAEVVKEDIIRLSKHRVASHVVSSAMVHCPAEDVQRLTKAVLHDAGQLAELSRREYGSFVVREVNRAARLLRDEQ